jgi:hypothetical protein
MVRKVSINDMLVCGGVGIASDRYFYFALREGHPKLAACLFERLKVRTKLPDLTIFRAPTACYADAHIESPMLIYLVGDATATERGSGCAIWLCRLVGLAVLDHVVHHVAGSPPRGASRFPPKRTIRLAGK